MEPVHFGFKIWMLFGPSVYPYNSKSTVGKKLTERSHWGARYVINKMLTVVTEVHTCSIFLDNYFTSYQLMYEHTKKIRACGTVCDNRTNHCPLKPKKVIEKEDRGSFDYRSDCKVLCIKWNDNRAVTDASNYYRIYLFCKTERYLRCQEKKQGDGRRRCM